MPGHAASGLKPGRLGPGQKPPQDVFQRMKQKSPGRDGDGREIITAHGRMKQKKVTVKSDGGGRYTVLKRMKQGSK